MAKAGLKQCLQSQRQAQRRALAQSLAYYQRSFDDAKQGMATACATGDYTLQAMRRRSTLTIRRPVGQLSGDNALLQDLTPPQALFVESELKAAA